VHYWNWDGISSVRRRVLEDSERQQKAAWNRAQDASRAESPPQRVEPNGEWFREWQSLKGIP
jgi:hypothetical protein